MYTREQASQLRQAFWTTFGQYIAPHLSADGIKTNWINYNTGFKYLSFRMSADKKSASIGIELSHPDADIQALYYEQFLELKKVLQFYTEEPWKWEPQVSDEFGKTISRIYTDISPVNVFNQDDWPKIISFLKPRIIALDEFWSNARCTFEALR